MARENATSAAFAALRQRVDGLEADYQDLKAVVVGLDNKIDKGLASLASEFRGSFAALSAKLDERGRPQWMVLIATLSLIVAIMTALGTLAYLPVKASVEDLQAQAKDLRASVVSRAELSERGRNQERDADRLQREIDDLTRRIAPAPAR